MKTKPLEDPRQEQFVQNLVKGMSQRQAYREAYKSKAKDKSIDDMASRLAKRVEVESRYADLASAARGKADEKAEAQAEKTTDMAAEIIDSYKRILRADPKRYLRLEKTETGRTITVPAHDFDELDGLPIQEIYADGSGVRIKFVSKDAAIKALAEIYAVHGESENTVRIEIEELEDADV